jgi:drug/metabolite transporter (DMT)-like permease
VVLAALVLGEGMRSLQLVGGAAIVAATILIGLAKTPEVVP